MTNKNLNINSKVYSVSEFSNSIKYLVEQNFQHISIKGEISKLSLPASGHIYFNLKDTNSVLAGVIWRYNSQKIKINVEEGIEVICIGKITAFSGQSKYQMIIERIEYSGEGEFLKIYEKRKKKFFELGYFDQNLKKKIPLIPRAIAIITSETGAVIQDIIQRISDRFPLQLYIYPVSVQGDKSAYQISNALETINKLKFNKKYFNIDLIIVARGGGSVEDLWSFNEENVIKSAHKSNIPIISAIGHETDMTLLDFVADIRAPTPSAAAEISVPLKRDLIIKLNDLSQRKFISTQNKFENLKKISLSKRLIHPRELLNYNQQRLDYCFKDIINCVEKKMTQCLNKFYFKSNLQQFPYSIYNDNLSSLKILSLKLQSSFKSICEKKEFQLLSIINLVEANNYERNLRKGFAIVLNDKREIIKAVKSKNLTKKGKLRFYDGELKILFED